MADQKITELGANTTPLLTDLLALVDDPSGTPATEKMEVLTLWSILNPPRGFLINGKIVPSVATDNLTVAIKGLDGNDPSATNPVYCRIGDTVRSITAALSVTKNSGTNWCASGSTEMAAQEIDYFVYLGYNATDGVVVGFSRIPYGHEYDSFSATSNSHLYCAISTISNAAAGDDYELVGRFSATLAAAAGYEWTVPTLTNKNVIQRPIYETRWLTWIPVHVGFSADPTVVARYKMWQHKMDVLYHVTAAGTSDTTAYTLTLPFAPKSLSGTIRWKAPVVCTDNGSVVGTQWGLANITDASATVSLYVDPVGLAWTGSGNKAAVFSAWYEV